MAPVKCSVCLKSFPSHRAMEIHKRRAHRKESPSAVCSQKSMMFNGVGTTVGFSGHLHCCNICMRKFISAEHLFAHKKTHGESLQMAHVELPGSSAQASIDQTVIQEPMNVVSESLESEAAVSESTESESTESESSESESTESEAVESEPTEAEAPPFEAKPEVPNAVPESANIEFCRLPMDDPRVAQVAWAHPPTTSNWKYQPEVPPNLFFTVNGQVTMPVFSLEMLLRIPQPAPLPLSDSSSEESSKEEESDSSFEDEDDKDETYTPGLPSKMSTKVGNKRSRTGMIHKCKFCPSRFVYKVKYNLFICFYLLINNYFLQRLT